MSFFTRGGNGTEVYINIYDLTSMNNILYPLGLGFYHTGIEVYNTEFCYAKDGGIIDHNPKENYMGPLRKSICLGKTTKNCQEIFNMLTKMKEQYPIDGYHLLYKNCNTFANDLCMELLNCSIPRFLIRNYSCIHLPIIKKILKPPNNDDKFYNFSGKGYRLT